VRCAERGRAGRGWLAVVVKALDHLGHLRRRQQRWLGHRERLQVGLAERLDLQRHLHRAGERAADRHQPVVRQQAGVALAQRLGHQP